MGPVGARGHIRIPEDIARKIRNAIDERAEFIRERSLVVVDPIATMRDVDLLWEDIESGVLRIVDLTTTGSTVSYFVLGVDGFEEGAAWVLG